MGLIDLFDRLISERGSALVQEKHIAFIREQLIAADKKITSLDEEIIRLTTENQTLKAESVNSNKKQFELHQIIDQLKKDNYILKAKIDKLNNPTHNNLLDKEQILILQRLGSLSLDKALPIEAIMSGCQLSEQTAIYHLQELEDEDMIEHLVINNISCWRIDHDGRGYLKENNLLP